MGAADAAVLYSARVDRDAGVIIVRGADFQPSSSVTLGGVPVSADYLGAGWLEIPFAEAVYTAVQWGGSYRLTVDGTTVSVYMSQPITPLPPEPPPEPPPPTGGPDCPCIASWEASAVPKDNFSWCTYGQDGTQAYIFAPRDGRWITSAAFDPFNPFFDPVDPGNSISYCVLVDDGSYVIAEPVTNVQQFSDCENWMWINICI